MMSKLNVYVAISAYGDCCCFGVRSAAEAWAGEHGTVDEVELREPPQLVAVSQSSGQERGEAVLWVAESDVAPRGPDCFWAGYFSTSKGVVLGHNMSVPLYAAPTDATVPAADLPELTPAQLGELAWKWGYTPEEAIGHYELLREVLNGKDTPAPVATEAVAQGGGVDVEKVMALVLQYGQEKQAFGATGDVERGITADELRTEIRALLSASPAGVGVVREKLDTTYLGCTKQFKHGYAAACYEMERAAAPAATKEEEGHE